VKTVRQNQSLRIAVAASVLLHAVLLCVKFMAPVAPTAAAVRSGLEVILVNAKHDKKPLLAQALAQTNLDGGGRETEGRSKSPLPEITSVEDENHFRPAVNAAAVATPKATPVLHISKNWGVTKASAVANFDSRKIAPLGVENTVSLDVLKQREAEISKHIEDLNKQPKKTQITPSTRAVGYAKYYADLQYRVETVGTKAFPQDRGRKLYGDLVVSVPLFQDGTIYERRGGVRIERSSGNAKLDAAAVKIVRMASPFGAFPKQMRSAGRDDVWEVITRFKFARGVLETSADQG
jgi:protein TonB